jgi:hypothetical protein
MWVRFDVAGVDYPLDRISPEDMKAMKSDPQKASVVAHPICFCVHEGGRIELWPEGLIGVYDLDLVREPVNG